MLKKCNSVSYVTLRMNKILKYPSRILNCPARISNCPSRDSNH